MRSLIPATTCGLLLLVMVAWIVGLLRAPLNVDAGLYLSLARDMAQGQALYRDLPCDYPPAAIELLSVLGPQAVTNPRVVKTMWVLIHAANAALLCGLLLRWGYRREVALLAAVVFAAWNVALDGTAIVLEPLVNFFLLAAMVVLGQRHRMWSSCIAGLLCGAALMVKQYALLALPAILLLVLVRRGVTDEAHRNDAASHSPKQVVLSAVLFLVMIPLPAVIYALLKGLNVPEFVTHMATFGDRPGGYPTLGLRGLFLGLSETSALATLPAFVLMGIALLLVGRLPFHFALVGGLLGTAATLYVRDYPHYVQLPAVWAMLVAVELAHVLSRRLAIQSERAAVLLLMLCLPLVPRGLALGGVIYQTWRDNPAAEQQAVATEVQELLPQRDNVWVMNASWLYVLADLKAPGGDYRFALANTLAAEATAEGSIPWPGEPPQNIVVGPGPASTKAVLARISENEYRQEGAEEGPGGTYFLLAHESEQSE